jgi:hypothetical protein
MNVTSKSPETCLKAFPSYRVSTHVQIDVSGVSLLQADTNVSEEPAASTFDPEDEGNTLLRNNDMHFQYYAASQPTFYNPNIPNMFI